MMKKVFSVLIALLTLLSSSVCHAEKLLSIETLKAQTESVWQGVYPTVRNETITVDCPVRVPDAQRAPVLRVKWYPTIDKDFTASYDSGSWADNMSIVIINNWKEMIPDRMTPKDYQFIERFIPLEDVDFDQAYCQNSALTPRQAFKVVEGVFQDVLSKYGTAGSFALQPAYGISIDRLEDNEGNFLWEKELYALSGYQLLRGLPILGITAEMFGNPYAFESIYPPEFYLAHLWSEDSFCIGAHFVAEEAVQQEDIPLAPYAAVKKNIEKLITDGKIRKVYQVQLGYMMYLEPDHNLKHYVLVPSWVVDCVYYPSAKAESEEVDQLDSENYRENYRHRKVVFNAQTGELVDPDNLSRKRSNAPAVLTWDKVK